MDKNVFFTRPPFDPSPFHSVAHRTMRDTTTHATRQHQAPAVNGLNNVRNPRDGDTGFFIKIRTPLLINGLEKTKLLNLLSMPTSTIPISAV